MSGRVHLSKSCNVASRPDILGLSVRNQQKSLFSLSGSKVIINTIEVSVVLAYWLSLAVISFLFSLRAGPKKHRVKKGEWEVGDQGRREVYSRTVLPLGEYRDFPCIRGALILYEIKRTVKPDPS